VGIGMIFSAPERLWLLLPATLLVFLIAWKRKKPYFTNSLLRQIMAQIGPASRWVYVPRGLEVLAVGALVLAVIKPVLPSASYAVSNEGLDIVLALDLSSSMEEPIDMIGAMRRERLGIVVKEKTRIEAVKEAMIRFAESRRTDRLGVVVFSEEGYVVVPMTNDLPYVSRYLRLVDTRTLSGEGQTAIGEGIWTSIGQAHAQARDGARGRKGKVIVVLTDGENNSGRDVVDALQSAGAYGFRVHFIGVEVEQAKNAKQIIAAVNNTGGKYYDVRKEQELLQAYFDIDRIEKARFISTTQVKNVPHYMPFALTAFILLFAAQVLRTRAYFTEIS
jgi:Ca-activated chloride channel family protein